MKSNQYDDTSNVTGLIAWFARNHVAANLLMVAIVVVGIVTAGRIRQEIYPLFEVDTIDVDVQYRGASPEEVEQSVILPIESELRGLELTHRIESSASEGRASVSVEIMPGFDRNRALQEVTAAVARISMFPDEIEPPRVSLGTSRRRGVNYVAVSGNIDTRTLIQFAHQVEDGLLAQPEIALVEALGIRRPEILIEVPQAQLRSMNLTLGQIAQAIDRAALDVPAGTMRTSGGDILLKTTERRYFGSEFAEIPIKSSQTGAEVKLGDIAYIEDGFEETKRESYYNGMQSVSLSVYASESQPPIKVAQAVNRFIEQIKPTLPPSVTVEVSYDRTEDYKERINLLKYNGTLGLLLVLFALGLLLELRVAFWTAVGIPVSILGSLILLPLMDASVNMISVFGFIVTLGIVVDDAIVIGENIYAHRELGKGLVEAALDGTVEVVPSVGASVTTTVFAFMPMFFVTGVMGKFFAVLPMAVIAMLVISLLESTFILPCHLAHGSRKPFFLTAGLNRLTNGLLDRFISGIYTPIVRFCVAFPAIALSFAVSIVLLSVTLVINGTVPSVFFPKLDAPEVVSNVIFPDGTPSRITEAATQRIEECILELNEEFKAQGRPLLRVVHRLVGEVTTGGGPGGGETSSGGHVGKVHV
ncbi:MAG: efflux RND transporter permease subunit, partial [Verrucomicrobiae bacterium]|nr:efflux RND transporter permease subunit [Verrucomicrobiae bacterium]